MIFKQVISAALLLSAFTFASCSEENAETTETETTVETSTQEAEDEALLLNSMPASPGVSGAQSASVVSPQAGAQSATKGSTQAAKTAAGLNPPHGEPGHRCDINVGEPLNSAPNTQTAAPAQTNPANTSGSPFITQPQSSPAPQGGSGRINPAHGQPGHDCAVAVGAPLP